MRFVVVFCSLLCTILASPHLLENDVDSEILNQLDKYVKHIIKEKFKGDLVELTRLRKDDIISADIDEIADKIIVNIRTLLEDFGLDHFTIPDQIDIKPSLGTHLNLTEGTMSGISSLQRYQHATLIYDKDKKKVSFSMILRITEIDFIFKYQSQVLFVHSTGHLHGKIEKAKIRVKLGFDFENYRAFVDDVDVNETGKIKLWLSGNSGIDWLSNVVIGIVTGILHPLILGIVTNVINTPINSVIEAVNEAIGQFLHPPV